MKYPLVNHDTLINHHPQPTDAKLACITILFFFFQDEYTAMRPWPCDFCSRRFRKKAALMNHMVAHQNDRPHACNLCGVRYVRKCDLMNHLKVHAFVPENTDSIDYGKSIMIQDSLCLMSPQFSNNWDTGLPSLRGTGL